MSIIYDVRIKQDFNKDGKYVCDLNHKEETKVRSRTSVHSEENYKFVWSETGIGLKDSNIDVIDPAWFMDASIRWFRYSKDYKWKFSWGVTRETYIRNIIKELEKLI